MKKRVLFLIPTLAHGGAERVLVNLVNNMDRERFDVTVQTLFDVGVNRQYLSDGVRYKGGLRHVFRGNSRLLSLCAPETLYRRIVGERYDVVVSYLEGPTARIAAGARGTGAKTVQWLHIELGSPRLAAQGFRSRAEALRCYDGFDRIVAVAESVKKCFLENMPTKTPVDVLYNTNETVKIRALALAEPDDPAFTPGGLRVCSVAKLMRTKGFDRLLEAHARLLREGIAHRVFILGVGEERPALEAEIKRLGVGDSFVLLGFKDNPYPYVARSDLYVCSSRREGFSTAVTEALILGTPVVSTDCSGARELLGGDSEYGLVVENSAEGVYAGMKRLLSDPALLAEYRERAAVRGRRFDTAGTVRAVEDMLDGLVEGK